MRGNDWEPTLSKRGFNGILSNFLDVVRNDISTMDTMNDALKTHELCEMLIEKITEK